MKKFYCIFLILTFFTCGAFASSAANLSNGSGIAVGYARYEIGLLSSDSLAVKYALNDAMSVEGSFGLAAGDVDEYLLFGAKVMQALKRYESFDVYAACGANLGYASPLGGDSLTIFNIYGGAGIEYFIAKNLSVSTELGLNATFADGFSQFSTFGNWFSNFGVRYYLD